MRCAEGQRQLCLHRDLLFVPRCMMFPGTAEGIKRWGLRARSNGPLLRDSLHVSVVNSYDAASDLVPVNVVSRVDLPTLGNPMRDTRASPDFETSVLRRK